MVDYSKWDNIWISSDDDADCHPNIEKYAWRRLKQRMRAEKGEQVQEVQLKDKWSSTNVNRAVEKKHLAETDPEEFLKKYRTKIEKYADMKDDIKADGFLMANPELACSLTEGFLITQAVDRAVENADDPSIERVARRCLQVHNLNVSAQAANIPAEKSVPLFFKHLKSEAKRNEYDKEFEKQLIEIKQRIETRRKERLEEAANEANEEEVEGDYEKAPLGPGGLDPTEVLQSLPEEIQSAFVDQDKDKLVAALEKLPRAEANNIIKRCIDSGLWNPGGAEQEEEVEAAEPVKGKEPEKAYENSDLHEID